MFVYPLKNILKHLRFFASLLIYIYSFSRHFYPKQLQIEEYSTFACSATMTTQNISAFLLSVCCLFLF